jgi:hypothetical protein
MYFIMMLCGCNPCKEEVWDKVTSPNGKWLAETTMRDCGATTAETLGVSISPVGDKSTAEDIVFVVKHGYSIGLSWIDGTHLKIVCHECAAKEVLQRKDRLNPIIVTYDTP